MKNSALRDKIISFIIGLILWWLIVYAYAYFNQSNKGDFPWPNWPWFNEWNFDPSNMSDEQIQRMADITWISADELKTKLDSWEDIRDLMPKRSWSGSNYNERNWTPNYDQIDN